MSTVVKCSHCGNQKVAAGARNLRPDPCTICGRGSYHPVEDTVIVARYKHPRRRTLTSVRPIAQNVGEALRELPKELGDGRQLYGVTVTGGR